MSIKPSIKSVMEFMEWVNMYSGLFPYEVSAYFDMYRGQPNKKWKLEPSIVRYAKDKGLEKIYKSISNIENELIEQFEKYSTPYKNYRSATLLEKLIDGQHYGLPTRLLDWTTNPLKALYFSVEDTKFDNVDGTVYGFAATGLQGTKDVKLEDNHLEVFFPELLNERLSAQEGCFTSFPLPTSGFNVLPLSIKNYPESGENLEKVIVDAKAKVRIRVELSKLGINRRTIYPGLEGVAQSVKTD